MLFPRSHQWTPLQRWLITAGVVLGLVAFGILVYSYERFHRGPSESALFGTWEGPQAMDATNYFTFNPDHSLVCFGESLGHTTVFFRGTWFAGGTLIMIRAEGKLAIWRIVEIQPDALRIRHLGAEVVYRRVKPTSSQASKQI